MGRKKMSPLIPALLASALLASAPVSGPVEATAAEQVAAAASVNVYKGKIVGVSRKARSIAVEVKGTTEMVRFDDDTKGMEHLKKGEAAIIEYETRGTTKVATLIKPKLAKLPPGVVEIEPEKLAELVALGPEKGNYFLVDSRPASRYHAGHIPTAASIPVEKLKETGSAALAGDARSKDIQLVFYCGGPT